MNRPLLYAFSLICLGPVIASAKPPTEPIPYRQVLSAVPSAELPAQAAEMVKQAKSLDRVNTTVEVTKAAVTIRAAAAPSIVGAIARAVPEMAAVAAGTAVDVQTRQATAIAKAASAAAPSEAAKIVAAICRVSPKQYRSVAIIVAKTVPGSAKNILMAVASAMPELSLSVESALAAHSGDSISVAMVLDQVAKEEQRSAERSPPRGPTLEPPFLPLSSTVKSLPPNISGEVPTGGRDYGKP